MADRLDVGSSQRDVVEFQDALRGVVGELQSPLGIDHDDPLEHPRQNGLHVTAIASLLGQPTSDFMDGLVERPGDLTQFVVAEVDSSRREVARTVATGQGYDAPHPLADPSSGVALSGAPLTVAAFSHGLPGSWGGYIVSVGLALFAFSTILGWSYYGERAISYLIGEKAITQYRSIAAGRTKPSL